MQRELIFESGRIIRDCGSVNSTLGRLVSNVVFQEDSKRLAQCVTDAQDEVYTYSSSLEDLRLQDTLTYRSNK